MSSRLDASYAVLRTTGVPKGWYVRPVSSLVRIVGGGTPDRDESSFWRDGAIPWITPTDLTANLGKFIGDGADRISELGLANSNAQLVPAGSIIFSTRGTVGNLAVAAVPLTTNQSCEVLIPRDGEVCGEFLFYLLTYGMFAYHRLAGGTTFGSITRREIGRVHFALPDRPEQLAIITILAAIDKAIERAREALDRVAQLRTSLVNQVLTVGLDLDNKFRTDFSESDDVFAATKLGRFPREWRVTALGKLCTKITDGTHQAVVPSHAGIPFLYVSCVRNGTISWDRAARVNERDYKIISKGREPRKGSVLYTAVGSYGHAAAIDEDKQFSFQRHIAILYPKPNELDPLFLATWLNSSIGKRWSDILAVGNAQKTVTLTALNKFPIAVPTLDEQLRIRALLEPANSMVKAKEEKLKALEVLKKSLMRDLLTGAVRVDPNLFKEEERG